MTNDFSKDYKWFIAYETEISLSIHRFIVLFELKILSPKINILNVWRLESSLVKYSRVLALVFLDPIWSDLKMNPRIRILLI